MAFKFKHFSVLNDAAAMKVGTDGVLLGAAVSLDGGERTVLDVGTGTGVVALCVAQRIADRGGAARITAIDVDGPSAGEAALNFASSPWGKDMAALECSLVRFEEGLAAGDRFDLIVSNPPYFDSSLENPDPRDNVARHTGSLSYRDILRFSAERLRDGGRAAMILPSDCERALLRTAASFGIFPERILRVSMTDRKAPSRIVAEFRKSEKRAPSYLDRTLVVRRGGEYSEEYRSLMRDFYLDF